MMEKFYVYIYLDPRKNGIYTYNDLKFNYEPFYVGKGKGKRMFDHLHDNSQSYKKNKIKKIEESGLHPIILKIYENLTESESFEKETETILKIGRLENGPLVNLTNGGEGQSGYKHREIDKIKIGESVKKSEKYQKSIKSEEHRKRLSLSLMGHKGHVFTHSEISKEKIRKSKIGNKNSFFGKTHSDELKNKWGETRKGDKNSNSVLFKIKVDDNIIEIIGRNGLKSYIDNYNEKSQNNVSFHGLIKYGKSKNFFIINKLKIYKK